MTQRLSKSRFVAGCQCYDFLWWKVHEPDAPEFVPDVALEDRFEQGTEVGERARTWFPGGVLIDLPHTAVDERVQQTREALEAKAPAIYEATFVEDDVYVAVDVLERVDGGHNLIEVKSTTDVKEEHYPDAAVQTHVLRKAGIDVRRVDLMHLNKECRYPDLSNLFIRENVTPQVEEMLPGIPGQIAAQLEMLDGPFPGKGFGEHCLTASYCPFQERCFPDMSGDHVMTLHGVGPKKAWDLMQAGYHHISDLPPDHKLSKVNRRQLAALAKGGTVVEDSLGRALEPLVPPLAFLDFETVGRAIPVWDGCKPYEQVPAQFSCHVDPGDGQFAHHEWLADGRGDPREGLARALVEVCKGARLIVTYNVGFERGRIRHLAEALPDLAPELEAIDRRLFDLLPVVRNHVYHPAFEGSFSIKDVLPVLAPDLDYGSLDVSEGQVASVLIGRLMLEPERFDAEERTTLRRQLLEYCELDTWAMVKLLQELTRLAQ